jgi:hypothetical protein
MLQKIMKRAAKPRKRAKSRGSLGGLARAKALSAAERKAIAQEGARARWYWPDGAPKLIARAHQAAIKAAKPHPRDRRTGQFRKLGR